MSKNQEDKIKVMQRVMGGMIADLEEALRKPCPQCWGNLERQDISRVKCPACNLFFSVNDINSGKIVLPQKT